MSKQEQLNTPLGMGNSNMLHCENELFYTQTGDSFLPHWEQSTLQQNIAAYSHIYKNHMVFISNLIILL